MEDVDALITPNFRWAEFKCRCGCVMPDGVRLNVLQLAFELEVLRRVLGDTPIKVVSGYRCARHNANVGGASQSEHLSGRAVDLQHAGYAGLEIETWLLSEIAAGRMLEGGVGTYRSKPGTAHYDIRGTPARWRG